MKQRKPTMLTIGRAGEFMYRKGIRSLNELLRRYNIVIWNISTVTFRDLNGAVDDKE